MRGHGKVACSCGAIIAQCRCIEGHKNVTVIQNGCPACQGKRMVITVNTDTLDA